MLGDRDLGAEGHRIFEPCDIPMKSLTNLENPRLSRARSLAELVVIGDAWFVAGTVSGTAWWGELGVGRNVSFELTM